KSHVQTDAIGKYIGKGLLTNTGASWLRQRRLIQPGFHRDRLQALTQIMQAVIDEQLDQLAAVAKAQSEQPVDIFAWTTRMAFQIIAKAIYSEDINEAEMDRFGELVTLIQEHAILEVRLPFLRWYFKLSGKRKRIMGYTNELRDLQRRLLQKRRQSGQQRDDLLQMLLDARYEDTGEPMEDDQLIDEALILFVAGHETSANALAWTLYLLEQHPEELTKVRTELDQVLAGQAATFEQLRALPQLTQAIQESMRLYPPAWITDRVALTTDHLDDFDIPEQTMTILFVYGIHRNPKYWEEPEAFRPARFAPAAAKERHNYAYLPFGGGPRQCIGNSFAMMEMQLVLSAWIKRFSYRLPPETTVSSKALVTLRPQDGIPMYLHENE
ncbi:MAG: cytochrome P450, partial [Bacteroidota bacterium]